jgi:acyl carrier protein
VEYTTSLRQELELDSLDLAVFMLAVQEKYNVKISDEELEELDNIAEIVQRVNDLLN